MPDTMNNLTYRPGKNAETVFARSKPAFVNAVVLAAGVESLSAVPSGANYCIFSADGDFYCRADGAAAIPAASVSDGSAPELNSAQWDVNDVSSLHLIAPEDTVVTLSFYL
jgi:hypothetical protein